MSLFEKSRRLNDYASASGYLSAFPNCHQADYGDGVVYGGWMIPVKYGEWRDVEAVELGNPQTDEDRFRAVNDYASSNGFGGGFPNGHEARHDGKLVYGVVLLKTSAVTWRDVPARELSAPQTTEDRFRAVDSYATNNGFSGGFPNCHEANRGDGVVYGVILLNFGCAVWADVPKRSRQELVADYYAVITQMPDAEFEDVCTECVKKGLLGADHIPSAGKMDAKAIIRAIVEKMVTTPECRECVEQKAKELAEWARREKERKEAERMATELDKRMAENLRADRVDRWERIDRSNAESERFERWRDTGSRTA